MKCIYCNSEVADGMQFCPYCGKEQIEMFKCNACGETFQLHKDMMFCPNCGNKIVDNNLSDAQSSLSDNNIKNPLEEHVKEFLYRHCNKDTLDIVCFVAFFLQFVYIIYNGRFLGFSGFLYDLSYNLTDILPEWLLLLCMNLSYMYMSLCVIDTCYSKGLRSWVNYCLPIAWGLFIFLLLISNFTFVRVKDLRLLLQFVIIIDLLQIYLACLINKTDLAWLGKVLIVSSISSIIQVLVPDSIIIFVVDIILTIYLIHTIKQSCYNY